jgi:hypothetical protein
VVPQHDVEIVLVGVGRLVERRQPPTASPMPLPMVRPFADSKKTELTAVRPASATSPFQALVRGGANRRRAEDTCTR